MTRQQEWQELNSIDGWEVIGPQSRHLWYSLLAKSRTSYKGNCHDFLSDLLSTHHCQFTRPKEVVAERVGIEFHEEFSKERRFTGGREHRKTMKLFQLNRRIIEPLLLHHRPPGETLKLLLFQAILRNYKYLILIYRFPKCYSLRNPETSDDSISIRSGNI